MLEQLNFPFIVTFIRSFKDKLNVYLLAEYIKGVELFTVIRDIGSKSKMFESYCVRASGKYRLQILYRTNFIGCAIFALEKYYSS